MTARERARDRGRMQGERLRATIASELREARLSAGVGQQHLAQVTGLSQSMISRTERNARAKLTVDELAVMCSALGLRLHLKAYPAGSPVRDAGQLRLLQRFRAVLGERFRWRSEVPVGDHGDMRAWDVVLEGPGQIRIGVDAETRLHDLQATQRRLELKWRDSGLLRVVLLVAATRHNRAVLHEHRPSLLSTLPLDSTVVLAALRAGDAQSANGIVIL
ncbi:MAG: helix-turn-helix domain-containing protein [Chloroflexota bacterium]